MRCKGTFVGVADDDEAPGEYMLQGVDEVFEIKKLGNGDESGKCRLLFVGRGIDEGWLEVEIKKCRR